MPQSFKTASGADVLITPAPWKDAKLLKMAIEKAAAAKGILGDINVVNIILAVDSSFDVDAYLWPCLIRCTRNGQKITEETFDDVGARADYYEIVEACLKENFSPLAASLSSRFSGLLGKKLGASPDSTSETNASSSQSA